MNDYADRPPLDPHPLSDYVAWAGRRNRDPILATLKSLLPADSGEVLELASGSGMHINYFAPHFPHLTFQPSDRNDETFDHIRKLRDEQGNRNVRDPIVLDLMAPDTWPREGSYRAMFCINVFQVAPVSIAEGMMACAASLLDEAGFFMVYGPFSVDGRFTTPSNEEFHWMLRSAGVPEWGLKDVADLRLAAEAQGLRLAEQLDMPANNFSLIFRRA
ncbi:hypothetical protein MIT9_P0543 [Methylomarinovum caldicuralii]|uniref:DUF938 domain-containing protein n=1 Tax=Methylomarinovum caldicuralii TaxID=438856 RepID=A0AAU9BXJ3_9GAMM|nr:DUF938 domain-containing protein [Methylomarinovum caldicuralii]BCX80965.1 hypothetical protein MIT9_P0543 [Methylomarinovum caldicuralii]